MIRVFGAPQLGAVRHAKQLGPDGQPTVSLGDPPDDDVVNAEAASDARWVFVRARVVGDETLRLYTQERASDV